MAMENADINPSQRAATVTPMRDEAPVDKADILLYAGVVASWSLSWYAIIMQLGVVAPEVSLVWRFALAAAVMIALGLFRRETLRFSAKEHAMFAATGLFMFSTNFLFFYYAGQYLVSGLLSVVFSLASIFNIALAAIFLGQRPGIRTLSGAAMGVTGIGLMFWPEISTTSLTGSAALGLMLCICGTLCFCTGNMISATMQRRKIPVMPATAWGMVYGTFVAAFYAFVAGKPFIIEWTPEYIGSLIFLAVVSSVLAFTCYLTLLGRIGSGRAAYATVMFPVLALILSTFLEGYSWSALATLGLALALAGNAIVLTRSRKKAQAIGKASQGAG
ncbi:MAG: DMT family transporter [Hyphomicrobiales bacterium]